MLAEPWSGRRQRHVCVAGCGKFNPFGTRPVRFSARLSTKLGDMAVSRPTITVWGINYAPESIGIAPFNRGLCRYFLLRGYTVRMVSTFAYYPSWRKSPSDRHRLFRTDHVDGVPVDRCWHYVPERVTTLRRVVHELSFGVTSLLRILSRPRSDIYVVVGPPLLLGPLAWLTCVLKRSRYVFHVQDLQPDAALALGMMKEGTLANVLRTAARFTYRRAAFVSGISQSMLDVFAAYGVPAERRYRFPNWVENPEAAVATPPEVIGRASLRSSRTVEAGASGLPGRDFSAGRESVADGGSAPAAVAARGGMPASQVDWRTRYAVPHDAFVASYSGNLGKKQGLDVLIDVARLLEVEPARNARPIRIVIAGDGAARAGLEAKLRANPPGNLKLLPLLPDDDYRTLLATSGICLIVQAKGAGSFCFPSKLLSTVAAGRPVLAVAEETSELALAVREGQFGLVVDPDRPAAAAAALREWVERPEEIEKLGQNGLRWVRQFEYHAVLEKFEARLRAAARS